MNYNEFKEKLKNISTRLSCVYSGYLDLCKNNSSKADIDVSLLEQGFLTENELLKIYSEEIQCLLILEENEIKISECLPGISENYLQAFTVIPYSWNDDKITLLVASPYDIPQLTYEFGRFFEERDCEFIFTRRSIIERMINSIYLQALDSAENEINLNDENTLRKIAGEAKIVKLVNEMISRAIEQNASDIHIEPTGMELHIRFRIDGLLRKYLDLSRTDFDAIASRIKLIGGLNIAENRRTQDGRTNFKYGPYDIDIRISTIPIAHGESIVMRLLRKDAMAFDLHFLGMPDHVLTPFQELIKRPHGMILVVGPTGSGKTTTLYSIMTALNNITKKIITVEDPIEYQLSGLNQVQVNPHIGLTFASGLRSIVRQDPDVILVGEIRDSETADIAINAALTGHLVLSTLHTNDAAGAITRLLDMGVPSFLITSSLVGVLSQRLVRKLCVECHGKLQDGYRCTTCGSSGYKGRTGIYELLIIDEEIQKAIIDKKSSSEINKIAKKNGMVSLLECGQNCVKAGITTEAELTRAVTIQEG